jgi:hypothetical protein
MLSLLSLVSASQPLVEKVFKTKKRAWFKRGLHLRGVIWGISPDTRNGPITLHGSKAGYTWGDE